MPRRIPCIRTTLKTLYLLLALCLLTGSLPTVRPQAHPPLDVPQRLPAPSPTTPRDPLGPGWHHVTIDEPVTPEEARAARANAEVSPSAARAASGLPSTAAAITPEIEALARALQDDPRLIFDYVHNHIDYVPIYGTLNGATGTLLAGRGTDADQAALFIALMREAGYTANYVIGDVTYSADRLANWVGTERAQADDVFTNGGVPVICTIGPDGTTCEITRVWAEAEIGGTTYTFDPAMKVYEETEGIAKLGAALGYNSADFLDDARIEATVAPSYTLHLNEAKIKEDMTTYAMNLVDYIDENLPHGGVADVIGGREIVQTEMTAYDTSLPEALGTSNTTTDTTLPSSTYHTLQIQHEDIDHTFNTFQLADQRVTVFYDEAGSNEPVLRVGGTAVATGTATTPDTTYPMTVTIEHPYIGHPQPLPHTFNLVSGGAYAVIHDFNTVSADVLAASNARLTQYRHDGVSEDAEAVLGETLSLMGWTWHHQVSRFTELVDRVGDVRTLQHHRVGVMGQEDGTFIDVPMSSVSVVSRDGASDTWAAFRTQTMMSSAFEHGVIEQLQGTPSASTIKLLQINNTSTVTKTFLANSANWSTVEPQLKNYSASTKNYIDSGINAGHEYVLPEDAHITLNQWRGVGYIDDWQSADGSQGSMGMIISGGYYGGYGTISETVDVGEVISATTPLPPDRKEEIETPDDKDPVDMSTGAFHYGHVDLALGGSEPFGLRFARTYNSGSHYNLGPLGYGWSHTYDLSLRTHSDGPAGLGARGVRDASALIAYAHVALDLLADDAGGRTPTDWMATSLATKWAMDELIDNAVTVHTGEMTLTFIQLADGTYAPPPGVHRALLKSGGDFYLQGAYNGCYTFDGTSGTVTTWEDPNGNTLSFAYDAGALNQVASSLGITLTLSYNGDGRLSQVSDHVGRVITYTYNSSDELTTFTDAMGHPYTYTYDTAHRLTSITRPEGNTMVTNAYDDQGRVFTQTDALDNTSAFYFGGFRNVSEGPDSSQTVFHIDDDGRLIGLQNDEGDRSRQSYDGRGRVTAIVDRLGDTTTLTYDAESGQLASVTNAQDDTVALTYTAHQQTFGHATFTSHLVKQVTYPDSTLASFAYDSHGNPTTYTDQAGEAWTFTYDGTGQVETLTNPAGGVVTYTFNADGTLASSTDSDVGITTYNYDDYRRLIRITHPDGSDVQIGYNRNGQITSITDEKDHTYTYSYDANGNLATITDPLGYKTAYAYDLMDRLQQITDRLGHVSTFTYDALGQMDAITDANDIDTAFAYDDRGWLTSATQDRQDWQNGYDAEGILTSFTTPRKHTTSYGTDALGRTTVITDPLGQTTQFTWDAMGRLTGITDPLGRVLRYTYDARGQVTGASLPAVGDVSYTRDALGLVSQITDPNDATWTFQRTAMGSIERMTDPRGNTWRHTRDARGRLLKTTYPNEDTVTRSYDDAGNLTGRTYSDGLDLQFTYNARNELIGANDLTLERDAEGQITGTSSRGLAFDATYDESGRLTAVSYNDAFTVIYTYDPETGLLSQVEDSLTDARVDFTYDDDRRLTGVNRSNDVDTTYSWDAAGRLVGIQDDDIIDIAHTLDAAGQVVETRMTAPLDPADALTESEAGFTYDDASQVTTSDYSYDDRGRLTGSPGYTYTWDSADRLIGINSESGNDVTLGYNGMGDVITRTEGGTTAQYVYNYALGLTPMVGERDAAGGQFQAYYVWAPDGSLLYRIDPTAGNDVTFYHFDHTGSTLALTDYDGDVTDAYAYTPYGRLLAHEGDTDQPFTFVGQWGVRQEGATGTLYQMRARYYDANTARFLRREPLWPTLAEIQDLNPYQYAAQNPLMFADPTGLLKVNVGKIARIGGKIARIGGKLGKLGWKGLKAQENTVTKGYGQDLNPLEAGVFGIIAQVPGSDEMLDLLSQDWDNFREPAQGAPEYIAGGVTRDIVASPFSLGKFLIGFGRDLAWIHVGNRESPDKYRGFWTELGYEFSKQVTESEVVQGLIKGCEMIEEGYTKLGEWGAYGYRKTAEKAQETGKQYGEDLGTLMYGDRKEQARVTNELYKSKNPLTQLGLKLGDVIWEGIGW